MYRNLVKSVLKPWRASKYISRAMPGLVVQDPSVVLAACRAAGIDAVELRYLERYDILIDVASGIIANDIIRKGSFQLDLFEVASKLVGDRAPTFVNVGANMGTTCLNAHYFGFREFIAFEPVDKNFQILKKNLESNISVSKIDSRKLALGNMIGSATIQIHGNNCGRHSLKTAFNAQRNIVSEQVIEMSTLDGQNINGDCLIWIDTEGFEFEVLQGAGETLKNHCVGLCVEITPSVYSAEDLTKLDDLLTGVFSCFHASNGDKLNRPSASRQWQSGLQHDLICIR